MDGALTGLGLYTRRATADAPHSIAIAIDLGLQATAPQPDRPWACRISTPLLRPGPDGQAREVREVEALAAVAKATVRALVPQAIFAAAVTANGTRTWLLYAAGSDEATALATVRLATESAFAAHPGYIPTVSLASDPDWTGYSDLYPSDEELRQIGRGRVETAAVAAARTATRSTVQSLKAAGVDLTKPADVRYTAWLPTDAARAQLADRATANGLRVVPADPAPDGSTPLHLVRSDLPDLAIILRTERWLIHEAGRVGGRYEGWAAA